MFHGTLQKSPEKLIPENHFNRAQMWYWRQFSKDSTKNKNLGYWKGFVNPYNTADLTESSWKGDEYWVCHHANSMTYGQ